MLTTGKFLEITDQDVHNMVTCNTYGPVLLTRCIISGMIKRNKELKKRSLVVFTSGLAAIAPVPNGAVAAATKILNDFLTMGLEYELAEHSIDVMSWRPALVATSMSGVTKPDWFTVTPEHFVECGFAKVTSGVHAGYFAHEILHCVL